MVENLGIANNVQCPGFVSDREEILRTLKEADIFLFCHKTRESARCLGEALASGCPLIGYGSAYSKELVAQYGGGKFASVGDWKELANIVKDLDQNREKLRELVQSAAISGRLYERGVTLKNRIDLIKEYLAPAVSCV
jgi:glycosyltransferase involved in cell wall biosynthesis